MNLQGSKAEGSFNRNVSASLPLERTRYFQVNWEKRMQSEAQNRFLVTPT